MVRDLAEVYEWDQTRSQGLLIDVEHAQLGPITLPGPPLRFDGGGARREHSRAADCSTSTAPRSAPGWPAR